MNMMIKIHDNGNDNCDDLTDLEQNNQFLLPRPSYSELKKNKNQFPK